MLEIIFRELLRWMEKPKQAAFLVALMAASCSVAGLYGDEIRLGARCALFSKDCDVDIFPNRRLTTVTQLDGERNRETALDLYACIARCREESECSAVAYRKKPADGDEKLCFLHSGAVVMVKSNRMDVARFK